MQQWNHKALLSAFASILCFGLTPVLVAWLPSAIPSWVILFYALAVASVFLLSSILLFFRDDFVTFCISTNRSGWTAIGATSALSMLASLCFFYAITHAPRVEATVLTLMWPIFFVIFSILLDNYRPSTARVLLLVISFSGVYIIIAGQTATVSFGPGSGASLPGILAALMAALLGGLHSVVYKLAFRGLDINMTFSNHFIVIFFRSLFSVFIVGSVIGLMPALEMPALEQGSFMLIACVGLLAYAGTQVLYCYALMHLDETVLSNIQYLNPVVVTVLLGTITGDPISPYFLLGAGMIFVSQYLIQVDCRRGE